jgi:hypothetical protein
MTKYYDVKSSLNVGFVTSPKLCGASSHSINAFAVEYHCGGQGNIEEKVEKWLSSTFILHKNRSYLNYMPLTSKLLLKKLPLSVKYQKLTCTKLAEGMNGVSMHN